MCEQSCESEVQYQYKNDHLSTLEPTLNTTNTVLVTRKLGVFPIIASPTHAAPGARAVFFVPTPTLVAREELYTQMGFFLFRHFGRSI